MGPSASIHLPCFTEVHFMSAVLTLLRWFSGGANQYHTLYHCMRQDKFWVVLTVALDLAVGAGYALIAMHWWQNQRNLPPTPAKRALATMRNIFIFCCLCGYIFIPVKMFWPAWRLYDLALAVLVYYTWKYALSAKNLKVIYNELGKTQQLKADLDRSREESRRKSFFLNALSHDLRTPLNGLMLQAEVARMSAEADDVESLKSAVNELEAGARAAADLLETLLQSARLDWSEEPNQITDFPLEESLAAVASLSQVAAMRKGLSLICQCPQGLRVRTDRVKLERILANLVNNAVKFTVTGGIRVVAEFAGRGLEVHVVDTGPGIASEQQARVFEEFFQVQNHERDRDKGFGLGLAIARRLARQLGGDVEVESAVGAGSRFTVLLPDAIVRERPQAAPGRGEPKPIAAGQ